MSTPRTVLPLLALAVAACAGPPGAPAATEQGTGGGASESPAANPYAGVAELGDVSAGADAGAAASALTADLLATADRLTPEAALALAALPLSCIDRPHPAPRGTGYLYRREAVLRADFSEKLAFWGCFDWHSAVNSTWALVAILERYPRLPVAPLVVEKLDEHLNPEALGGEVEFFADPTNAGFERPYGWAWLLYLQAELLASHQPRAAAWGAAVEPLARLLSGKLADYFDHLAYPLRVGTHRNTAFAAELAWRYAEQTGDRTLVTSIDAMARRLFLRDAACPLGYEPSAADFLSPCLEEARLMATLLPREEAVGWLERFLPAPGDPALAALGEPPDIGEEGPDMDIGLRGARSHLIGLMFTRAETLAAIAAALGREHPRAAELLELADRSGRHGVQAMFEAGYLGSHWLGTFAVKYLIAREAAAAN